mmetsp:Transcript_10639/g.24684  ORF Transcript_10639/g.24684 Transcript_10639/m.24684 type:complete len:223 (-) Transcript_10639:148-816(-)
MRFRQAHAARRAHDRSIKASSSSCHSPRPSSQSRHLLRRAAKASTRSELLLDVRERGFGRRGDVARVARRPLRTRRLAAALASTHPERLVDPFLGIQAALQLGGHHRKRARRLAGAQKEHCGGRRGSGGGADGALDYLGVGFDLKKAHDILEARRERRRSQRRAFLLRGLGIRLGRTLVGLNDLLLQTADGRGELFAVSRGQHCCFEQPRELARLLDKLPAV